MTVTCHMTYRHEGEPRTDHDCMEWETLDAALAETRANWHEADGPQQFLFADEGTGEHLACLMRGSDPDACLTLYADGRIERHRVRYLLDLGGHYQATEITPYGADQRPSGPPVVVDAVAGFRPCQTATYTLCTACRTNGVDAENGYDTCHDCLARQ